MIQSRSVQAAAVAAKQLQLLLPARGARSSSLVLPAALPRCVLQHKHKHTYSRHVSQPQPQVRRRWMCAMPGGGGGGGKPGMKPPPRHEYDQFGSQRGARQRTSRGPMTWATVTLAVAAGAGLVAWYRYKKEQEKRKTVSKVVSYGRPALGGPWELVNKHGEPVTDADFRGEYVLLYFGFTYCPDICPNEMIKMGKVIQELDKKKLAKVRPIFITLDPNRDTVAQMAAYIQDFHPRLEALTGTPAQIERASKFFRVYFSDVDREEDDDDYVVDHSIVMYFIAPNGDFLEFFTQMSEVPEIVERMETHIRAGSGALEAEKADK